MTELQPKPFKAERKPYLPSQGQEVVVELDIGHDFCEVFIFLYIFTKLQEHSMATQHECHLLLDHPVGEAITPAHS